MSRLSKLDRLLALVHALAEDAEGLTLDEMAERLGVNRRTAERMRDVIMLHFDLEPMIEGRHKRWRIVGRLARMFTQPTAQELAALQTQIGGQRALGQHARADLLASLLAKIRGSLDMKARTRTGPDLEALSKAQRLLVGPGPGAVVSPEVLTAVQDAIIAGSLIEFEYRAEGRSRSAWRRVIPYGLVHGSISYLVGKIPDSPKPPAFFRLDRMKHARQTGESGVVPDNFDLDDWLSRSFGIWRDAEHDIILRIAPTAAQRAREWRFHPRQTLSDEDDGSVTVSFRAGSLRELAEHLFSWGAEVEIVAPEELRDELVGMLETALDAHQAN
jgi:predicted DNA-binding transcriptional regulator YafY